MFKKISKSVLASLLSLSLISTSILAFPIKAHAEFEEQINEFKDVQAQNHDVVNVYAQPGAADTYGTVGGMIFRCEPGSTELSHNHEEIFYFC